jgi:hypothetical protein
MANVPVCFCATSYLCLENLRKSYKESPRSRLPLCALELRLSREVDSSPMAFKFECMVRTFFSLMLCILCPNACRHTAAYEHND